MKVERKRKVWVVNPKQHNVLEAAKFGELKTIFDGNVNVFAVDKNLEALKNMLGEGSSAHDYVLLCGSIPLNCLACNVMLQFHGRVNMLLFNLKSQLYEARTYTREDIVA